MLLLLSFWTKKRNPKKTQTVFQSYDIGACQHCSTLSRCKIKSEASWKPDTALLQKIKTWSSGQSNDCFRREHAQRMNQITSHSKPQMWTISTIGNVKPIAFFLWRWNKYWNRMSRRSVPKLSISFCVDQSDPLTDVMEHWEWKNTKSDLGGRNTGSLNPQQ